MNSLRLIKETELTHTDLIISKPLSAKEKSRLSQEAFWEKEWLQRPDQYKSSLNALTRAQDDLLLKILPYDKKIRAIDLGCGSGHIALQLARRGMIVDALDLAKNALKLILEKGVNKVHGFFPYTRLDDEAYDLVICNHLIAELPESDHRMAVSEIARLMSKHGKAYISTDLDIDSDEALIKFIQLLETELDLEELIISHHALSIRWPFFQQSSRLLNFLENCGKFFLQDKAISHVIAVGKHRQFK